MFDEWRERRMMRKESRRAQERITRGPDAGAMSAAAGACVFELPAAMCGEASTCVLLDACGAEPTLIMDAVPKGKVHGVILDGRDTRLYVMTPDGMPTGDVALDAASALIEASSEEAGRLATEVIEAAATMLHGSAAAYATVRGLKVSLEGGREYAYDVRTRTLRDRDDVATDPETDDMAWHAQQLMTGNLIWIARRF